MDKYAIMKSIVGIVFIIGAILAGLYVGFWLMIVNGIIGIIEQIQATTINSYQVAINILKVIFGGTIGLAVGGVVFFIGACIYNAIELIERKMM